jgi:hypothetical protein
LQDDIPQLEDLVVCHCCPSFGLVSADDALQAGGGHLLRGFLSRHARWQGPRRPSTERRDQVLDHLEDRELGANRNLKLAPAGGEPMIGAGAVPLVPAAYAGRRTMSARRI